MVLFRKLGGWHQLWVMIGGPSFALKGTPPSMPCPRNFRGDLCGPRLSALRRWSMQDRQQLGENLRHRQAAHSLQTLTLGSLAGCLNTALLTVRGSEPQ